MNNGGNVVLFITVLMFIIAILAGVAARINDTKDWERVSRVQTE